jgi:hypothetical protein
METSANSKASKPDRDRTLKAVSQLVEILEGLSIEERQRAIRAAQAILGEAATGINDDGVPANPEVISSSPKFDAWIRKNSISRDQIEHVYMIHKDSVEVIASSLPGKGNLEQTTQAYLLAGIRNYLLSGEAAFSDEEGRAVRDQVGCYNNKHHAEYIDKFGNLIAGSKRTGWKLTNPGLMEAAKLIQKLTEPSQ